MSVDVQREPLSKVVLRQCPKCGEQVDPKTLDKELVMTPAEILWATPQWLFDKLHAQYGFETDVCALPENAKCERYFTNGQADSHRYKQMGNAVTVNVAEWIGKRIMKAAPCGQKEG